MGMKRTARTCMGRLRMWSQSEKSTSNQGLPGGGSMGYDISPDRLCAVLRKAHAVRVCHYLIGENHGHSKFFRHACELS